MISDYPNDTRDRLALLDNLRVVLVSPKFPGNLGMTARAMNNCGVSDLCLVAPRAEVNKEAYLLAPTGAEILDDAKDHGSLMEAISDRGLVIGTSKRRGSARKNVISPEEAADMVRTAISANKVAVVFGAEDNGLSSEDLSLCDWVAAMHTGSESESFNLSHSVAIVLYLINRAVVAPAFGPRKLANAHQQEQMFDDVAGFLLETGFIHEEDPKRMMLTIRQMLHRSGLSWRDVKVIRGILRQTRWRIKNPDAMLVPRDTPQQIQRELLKKRKEQEKD